MNPDAIVSLLEPLRSPDAVPFWPPAPGWWVLGLIWLALLGYALYLLWRRIRAERWLRRNLLLLYIVSWSIYSTMICI